MFAESLGGVESLITHPVSRTHTEILEETREALGITDTLLRLSVGIEDADDIIADLDQALNGGVSASAYSNNERRFNTMFSMNAIQTENKKNYIQFDNNELLKQLQKQVVSVDNIDVNNKIELENKVKEEQNKNLKIEL